MEPSEAAAPADNQAKEKEPEFEVEKIIDMRSSQGKKQYYIKWKNFPHSANTWEPEENLNCPEIIHDFLQQRLEQRRKPSQNKRETTEEVAQPDPIKRKAREGELIGFARKLDPEQILGATDYEGQLLFLMKWKNSDEADLVPAHEANIICPQVVIKFYESRLNFVGPEEGAAAAPAEEGAEQVAD